MEQSAIREWNNQQYTAQEGADIIKELNARTSHGVDGFNSIAELGALLKIMADRIFFLNGVMVLRFTPNVDKDQLLTDDIVIAPKGGSLFGGDMYIARVNTDGATTEAHHDEPYLRSA